MALHRIAVAAVLTLICAGDVAAQSRPSYVPGQFRGEQLNVARLPISLERIQRELRQAQVRDESEGLNIRFAVEVFGEAPPLVIFGPEDDLVDGPVPHGGPTHREIIEHITPREYRAPPADVSALFRWLMERSRR